MLLQIYAGSHRILTWQHIAAKIGELSMERLVIEGSSVGHVRRNQRGQGMTEYIIIVALIAVSAIATYRYFGKTVRAQTAGIAQEVAGQSATTSISNAQDASGKAETEGGKIKGLDKFNSK